MMCEKSKNTQKQREIFTESYREKKNQSVHIKRQASNEDIFLVYFNVDMG